MWKCLEKVWQDAFTLAWQAYKHDTIPIGAIIVDAQGRTIAVGRNMIFDQSSTNCLAGTYMAHAEMTAMMQIKESQHPDLKTYTLYTTMEPCPMCFGTMLMMHIRHLKYAARDAFAGATDLKDKNWYLRSKKMTIHRDSEELEVFQIALQTAFECERQHRKMDEIFDKWSQDCPGGVQLGKELYAENYFHEAIKHNTDLAVVYDYVISRYQSEQGNFEDTVSGCGK